ncbi:MAG: BolA family transcriptional regulator [Rhizobiaceae bacterium]|nr:BolA family transcriptional regulator [Rhizobiaceae bacterium]
MEQPSIQAILEEKLRDEFAPTALELVNESHLHAGHQESFDGSGETHFRIKIVSPKFSGMNRVARHRGINALFVDLMETRGLHAIAIEAKAPEEVA